MYAEDHGKYGTRRDAFIYVVVNAYWERQYYTLPVLPEGFCWKPAFEGSAASADIGECGAGCPSGVALGPRSTAILIAQR